MRNREGEGFVRFLNAEQEDLLASHASIRNCEWPNISTTKLFHAQQQIARELRSFIHGKHIATFERSLDVRWRPQRIKFVRSPKGRHVDALDPSKNGNLHVGDIKLGNHAYCIRLEIPGERRCREGIYQVLKTMIQSGEFQKLSLCEAKKCENFIWQTTRPKRFCSDHCRWKEFNRNRR